MGTHGTASVSGAYLEFQAAVLKALPRDIDDGVALKLANDGEGLTAFLASLKSGELSVPCLSNYPAVGEVFKLTLDGDANPPFEMLKRDGYGGAGWKHEGPTMTGQQTRSFKLVQVGYCRNLDEVPGKLAAHGTVPEGQWREAFKSAYPRADRKGPVGFADPSWVHPRGNAFFPYVDTDGSSYFHWTGNDFSEYWRWLVVVSK